MPSDNQIVKVTDKSFLNKLSEDFLLKVKRGEDPMELCRTLESLSSSQIFEFLPDDNHKKAFWTNIYNAYYQILRIHKNEVKPRIYSARLFIIGREKMSLDDIEHGVLRRYRYKYSLGYFANPFYSKFIRTHAVDKIDFRIHFALNCGAKSCPPISFYHPERIDQQLELATKSFLEQESDIDDVCKKIATTTLFKWFFRDFGGRKGIDQIYKVSLGKNISGYKMKFKSFSWEENLHNFK
jgi:hypothetical protein